MGEPGVSDEEEINKLIQSAVEFLVSQYKKSCWIHLKIFRTGVKEYFINVVNI